MVKKNQILEKLYEKLYRENRHPLLLRVKRFGKFFPETEPKISVEQLSLKEIIWIKKIGKKIEILTSQISKQMNEKINHSFREKIAGEWLIGRKLVKEIERVEKEILEKFKKI